MQGSTAAVLLVALVFAVAVLIVGVNALSKKPNATREAAPAAVEALPTMKTPTTALFQEVTAPPTAVPPAPAQELSPVEQWRAAALYIPAKTLYEAYTQSGNTIATDQKYKGKKLAMTGTVQQVSTDPLGRGVLTLSVGELPIEVVVCLVDKRFVNELAAVQPNQAAAVVGTCQGQGQLGFGVTLEHCRLLHAATDAAALDRWIRGKPNP